jgi:hypothetical protein
MSWSENLKSLAHDVTLYSSSSLDAALSLPISVAEEFLSGKAMNAYQKNKEAEIKLMESVVQRLNTLIKVESSKR